MTSVVEAELMTGIAVGKELVIGVAETEDGLVVDSKSFFEAAAITAFLGFSSAAAAATGTTAGTGLAGETTSVTGLLGETTATGLVEETAGTCFDRLKVLYNPNMRSSSRRMSKNRNNPNALSSETDPRIGTAFCKSP